MKKVVSLILVVMLSFMFIACGSFLYQRAKETVVITQIEKSDKQNYEFYYILNDNYGMYSNKKYEIGDVLTYTKIK